MEINRLKQLRLSKGLTQKEAALAMGLLSQQRYNSYETGKREPDNEILVRFAIYFNVSVDYLLGNTDNPIPIPSKKKAPPDEQMALFLKQNLNRIGIGAPDRDLTDEELKALTEFINNNRDLIIWRAKQITESKDK